MSGDTEARVAEEVWARRVTWLRRWLVLSWVALVASTWRLWTPQVVFPQVPFFGFLQGVPGWADWVALGGVAAGLGGLLFAGATRRRPRPLGVGSHAAQAGNGAARAPLTPDPSPQGEGGERGRFLRAATLLAIMGTTVLVLLDQHRFQPWAYQFLIVAVVLAFAPAGRAASLLRVLTVGIYFWSAVSKFDYTFLHGLGPELLRGLLGAFQLEPRWMRPEVATVLAWAFPTDELAVAVLLAVRRTRGIGLVAAVSMHVLLLATLGPFGLDHSPGVLLWNVYFIGQGLLLFRRPAAGWRATSGPGARARLRETVRGLKPAGPSAGIAHAAVFLAVWLPALEPFGWLDHWPGWAVYAPSGEWVALVVKPGDAWGFPDEFREPYSILEPGRWECLDEDQWSLGVFSAPVYAEDRFCVGVAVAVIDRFKPRDPPRLFIVRRANRFTGERSFVTYKGAEIRAYAESFWLNALPRKIGGW